MSVAKRRLGVLSRSRAPSYPRFNLNNTTPNWYQIISKSELAARKKRGIEVMAKFKVGAYRGFGLDNTNTYYKEDWDDLAATKATVVRVPVWMYRAPTGTAYLDPDVSWLINALKQCASRNIGVIVVLCPLPAFTESEFWESPALQSEIINKWVTIANKVKVYPSLVGYDLINEPVGGLPIPNDTAGTPLKKAVWEAFSQRICTALRAADNITPIIWEPYAWGLPDQFWLSEPPKISNLVLSFHWYEPREYTHQGEPRVPLPAENYSSVLLEARLISARLGLPMYIGEFGTLRWSPDSNTWLNRAIALFKAENWNWSVFLWRPKSDGWDYEVPITAEWMGARDPTTPAITAIKAGIIA